jgi:hypothetical protein
MMMNAMVHLNWHHDDPEQARKEILSAVGDISWLQLFGSQVLLGDYMRPVVTRGNIITPDSAQNEDVFQGTVGMILAIGPQAWRASSINQGASLDEIVDKGDEERFGGRLPEIGEWVYCRPQDTVMTAIKGPGSRMIADAKGNKRSFEGWPCKLVYARDIYAKVDLPHAIL